MSSQPPVPQAFASPQLVDVLGKTLTLVGLALPAVGVFVRWIALGFDLSDVQVAVAASLPELAAVGARALVLPVTLLITWFTFTRGFLPWFREVTLTEPLKKDARRRRESLKRRLSTIEVREREIQEAEARMEAVKARVGSMRASVDDGTVSPDAALKELRAIDSELDSLQPAVDALREVPDIAEIKAELGALEKVAEELEAQVQAADATAPWWVKRLDALSGRLSNKVIAAVGAAMATAIVTSLIAAPGFPAIHIQVAGVVATNLLTLRLAKHTGELMLRNAWPGALMIALTGLGASVIDGTIPGLSPVEIHLVGDQGAATTEYRLGESDGRVYLADCDNRNAVRLVDLDDVAEFRYPPTPPDPDPSLWDVVIRGEPVVVGLRPCPNQD